MIAFFSLNSLSLFTNDEDEEYHYMQGISSSADSISVGVSTGHVIIIEYNANRKEFYERQKLLTTSCAITACAESKSHLACCNGDGDVFVFYSADQYRLLGQAKGSGNAITSVCIKGDIIVAGYMSGHIKLFRADVVELAMEVAAHIRMITGIDIHPTEDLFVTCSEDQFVQVWSLPLRLTSTSTTDTVFCRKLDNKLCTGVTFLSDGRICVASYDDTALNIFVPK